MKTSMLSRIALASAAVAGALYLASPALAAEGTPQPHREKWTFAGPFGNFDQGQLQRGFKVYKEVCATCHSLSLVSFRNLAEPGGPGYSTAQVASLAASYTIQAGPNDKGEMFERPGLPADRFPSPFPNVQAATAANGGAYPPDLSVIAKARGYERGFPYFVWDVFAQYQEHGADYLHSLLTGYQNPPAEVKVPEGKHYNHYFPGGIIAMPKPLSDGQVEYTDGTPATVDQYARDVTAFLMWTAEPHLVARKRMGLQVMLFLLIFAGLVYFTKKRVWSRLEH